MVGGEDVMDLLEQWQFERMLEEALTRGLRRLARKKREDERKRPYRELAAVLRQYIGDEQGETDGTPTQPAG